MDAMRPRSFFLLSLVFVGCGDPAPVMPDAVDHTLGEAPALAMPCTDSVSDVYVMPSGLPAMDDSRRGDVFRCAVAEKLTVPEIKTKIGEYNENRFNTAYTNTTEGTINSGFWTYRIAFRSTRNTVNGVRAEGDMAAVLVIPAKPLAGAPVVVWGHGSSGVASKCATSKQDLAGPVQDQDFPASVYRLAGYGYTVIAPDYAGFSYGQAVGYFNAEDEAHAILDATRAAAKILPTAPDKFVFAGHSQGGHAVLSAHSYAKSYGMHGQLVGVATFAPFWISFSLWAAATTDPAGLTTATDANSILYAMSYAYAAGELREPGSGVSVFQAAKQDAAKDVLIGNECYEYTKLSALGARPSDFFDATYVNAVGYNCGANPFTPDCTTPEAAKWKARWIEDRPALDPQGPPVLAMYGAKDTFITPARAQCGRDKFARDLAVGGATTKVEYCYSDVAIHRDILRGPDADYLNKWIAAKAGIGPEPGACPAFPTGIICASPPNDY
jgi:hypothetical protein